LGLPKWARKVIWPLLIQNQLEITENLYQFLIQQANITDNSDPKVLSAYLQIEGDLEQVLSKIPSQIDPSKVESILKAFVIYRPDIGYVEKVMPNLVIILLLHLEEYVAFQCFANLLHSFHFLSFFRRDMREITWHVNFFNIKLSEHLP